MGGEGRGCDHALPPPIRLHPRCKEGVSRTKVPCALLPLSCQAAGGTGRSFRRQDHDELLIRQNIRLHTGPARHNRECERPERAGMHLGDDNHQNNDQPRGAGRSKTAENSIGLISHGVETPAPDPDRAWDPFREESCRPQRRKKVACRTFVQ